MRRLIVAALLLAACAQDQGKMLVPSFALPPGFTGIEFGMTMEALESRRGVVVDSDQVYETVRQGYDVSYEFAAHPLGPWERGALIRMQVNQFGLLADQAQAIHDSLGTVLKDHGANMVLSTQYDRSPNAGSGARRSLTIWRTDSVDFAIDRGPSPGGGENVILRVQPRSVGITGLAPSPELADSIGGMSNDLGR